MNPAALIVRGHKEVEAAFSRHLPYWQFAGYDLIGLSGEDDTRWPDGFTNTIAASKSAHAGPDSLRCWLTALTSLSGEYRKLVMIEWDQLLFRPPQRSIPNTLQAHTSPNIDPRFKCDRYAGFPWIMSGELADRLAGKGWELLAEGDIEFGHNDRFMAYICKVSGVPIRRVPKSLIWACTSTEDTRNYLNEARVAIRNRSLHYIHGVRTKEDFDYLFK